MTAARRRTPRRRRRAAIETERSSALSAGSNALLRLGATPLTCAEDVLESFGLAAPVPLDPELGPTATAVLERVREGAAGADELARSTGLRAGELAAVLTELELAGMVNQEEGIYRASS